MGVSVLQLSIAQSIRTESAGRYKIPIAVGDDCVYFFKYVDNPRIIKVDLNTLTTSVSNNFKSEFGYTSDVCMFPYAIGIGRNNKIIIDCFVIDESEASGSRNLYLRRFRVDSTDLTLSAGTQRTLTGDANLIELCDLHRIVRFGESIIGTARTGTANDTAIKIDLHGMRYKTVEIDTTANAWNDKHRWICSLMVDRTTNELYYLTKAYYWIAGSYAIVEIIDAKTLQHVAYTQAYDSGCGDGCALHLYRDTQDKVRYYHVGNGGAPVLYTSHFGTFYVNNGSIVVETEVTIDSTYKDYSGGNTTPIALGVTSDGYIAWLLVGGNNNLNTAPSSDYTEGFQLLKTNDTFGLPTKVASATYSLTTTDYLAGDERRVVFLRENDWCYYAANAIKSSSPNDIWYWGKLDLADTGVSIVDDDPYGILKVPSAGLIPTTLTLTVTPL